MGEGEEALSRAIADAQSQLKRMWSLRVHMERTAQAAAVGAGLGITAAVASVGALIWIVSPRQGAVQYADLANQLSVALGLVAIVIAMTGYLWWRRSVALSSAQALEIQMNAIREELQKALEVSRRSGTSVSAE